MRFRVETEPYPALHLNKKPKLENREQLRQGIGELENRSKAPLRAVLG